MVITLYAMLSISIVSIHLVKYKSDQPYLEWMPSVLSAGYQYTDQLILWLLSIINISFPSSIKSLP